MIVSGVYKIVLISSIFLQICFADLPLETFRCKSGEYISRNLYCDGFQQCSDRSDEPNECYSKNAANCEPGNYQCNSTSSCIDANFICDGKKDCDQGDDEMNCGDEVDTKNCSVRDGRFLCHDGLRCLRLDYTCDGACNCFDCSDETDLCSQFGFDNQTPWSCSDFNLATPVGHRCPCKSSRSSRNNSSCIHIEIRNCENENICDQKCYRYKGRAQCSCSDDYITVPHDDNGFRCQSKKSSKHTLIYSTSSQIKLFNLTSSDVQVIKKPIECALLSAARDYMYYTSYSNENKIIFRHSLKTKMTTIVFQSNSSIISIAIDYMTDNLYFTTNTTLSVCSAKKQYKICTQLKCCNVKYITLAPNYGLMFYTKISPYDQDASFIMKSNMDGSSEDILVDGTFHISTSMSTDESIKRLYWFDVDYKKLFSVSFFGGNNELRSFQSSEPMISIAAFDSKVYFTKHRDNEIYILENYERFIKSKNQNTKLNSYNDDTFKPSVSLNADKFSTRSYSLVNSKVHLIDRKFTFFIESVFAYNPDPQPYRQAKNPCEEISCSGICLLRPTFPTNNLSYNCTCFGTASTNDVYWCNNTIKGSTKTEKLSSNVPRSNKPTSQAQTIGTEKSNNGNAVPQPSQTDNKTDTTTKTSPVAQTTSTGKPNKEPSDSKSSQNTTKTDFTTKTSPLPTTTPLVPTSHLEITTISSANSTHTEATTIITTPPITSSTNLQNPTAKSRDHNSIYKTIWFFVTIFLIIAMTLAAYFGHRRYRYNRSTMATNGGQTSYTTLLIDDHEL